MPTKMERFTQRARRVLSLAQDEAIRLKHPHIGTEHMLLALMREEHSIAGRALHDLNLQPDQVENIIKRQTRGYESLSTARMGLSDDTKRVLELAVDEARRMGHHYIGTEHILLGLVRHPDGRHVDVFNELSIMPEDIRRQTHRALQEDPPGTSFPLRRGPERRRSSARTPLIDQLATDLTAWAEEGKLPPTIGREREINAVIQNLLRHYRRNPLLVGEVGVGRTAVVMGLVQRIIADNVPPALRNARAINISVARMIAGTLYQGQFEERLLRVIQEIKESGAILFIQDIQLLIGAGKTGGHLDAAYIIGAALERGEILCIGEITTGTYDKLRESDAVLLRGFQPIRVDEPTYDDAIAIVNGTASRLANHHDLTIMPEACTAAVILSARYLPDLRLPAKALELLDNTAARLRIEPGAGEQQTVTVDHVIDMVTEMTDVPRVTLTQALKE